MNSDQLRYLIDISKTNSINATAKRLYNSQQAISESIKRLEQELNCTILNRSKTGVALTEDGKFVLSYAIRIINQYDTIQHHFEKNDAKKILRGKLTVGIALLATNTLLTKLIFQMHHQYPGITLYTQELPLELIMDELLNRQIDFALVGSSNDGYPALSEIRCKQNALLHFQELYTDELVCVMSRNNPLSTKKSLVFEQLYSVKQTMYNYSTNINLKTNNCLHISGNTDIHKKFMQEEGTVCCIPLQAFKSLYDEKNFVCLPITDAKPVTNYLIYYDDDLLNTNTLYQSFIDTTLSLVSRLQTS